MLDAVINTMKPKQEKHDAFLTLFALSGVIFLKLVMAITAPIGSVKSENHMAAPPPPPDELGPSLRGLLPGGVVRMAMSTGSTAIKTPIKNWRKPVLG
jgi:hypothetical protein